MYGVETSDSLLYCIGIESSLDTVKEMRMFGTGDDFELTVKQIL